MNPSHRRVRPRPRLLLAAALLAVGMLPALAGAGHDLTPPIQSYTGCLKGDKLDSIAQGDDPAKPCDADETVAHLSGGDITAVAAGTGLEGGALEGPAILRLGPHSCTEGKFIVRFGGGAPATCGNVFPGNFGIQVADAGDNREVSLTPQTCDIQTLVNGIDADGKLVCVSPVRDSSVGFRRALVDDLTNNIKKDDLVIDNPGHEFIFRDAASFDLLGIGKTAESPDGNSIVVNRGGAEITGTNPSGAALTVRSAAGVPHMDLRPMFAVLDRQKAAMQYLRRFNQKSQRAEGAIETTFVDELGNVEGKVTDTAFGRTADTPEYIIENLNGVLKVNAGSVEVGNENGGLQVHTDGQVSMGALSVSAGTGSPAVNVSAGGRQALSAVTFNPTMPTARLINAATGGNALHAVGNVVVQGTVLQSSDRAAKQGFAPVSGLSTLELLAGIPISTWSYKSEPAGMRHMGPTAQDFYRAFGLGGSKTHIATVDADGVAFSAIQGLYAQAMAKDAKIARLEARVARLERLVAQALKNK